MIRGEDIESLIRLLEARKVSLFHACQFLDFQSYLNLGGIPSRACLEANKQPFTEFETDGDDHSKGVWDKVFTNFSDFGKTFANGGKAVPNPYGPVLLQINPAVLREAIDVAVCFQPVGGSNFNREEFALKSIEAIDNLFVYPVESEYPRSTWIKFKETLREEYQCLNVCDPDISCTVSNGKLSFEYVSRVLVDPYVIASKPLREWIAESLSRTVLPFTVQERSSQRREIYNELASLIISRGISSCHELSQSSCVSDKLREWAQEIDNPKLRSQFRRFATYLRNGTLLQLS